MSTQRPVDFDQTIADRICEMIAMDYTIQEIVQDVSMPEKKTINRWRSENDNFFRQYIVAHQDQGQTLIDQVKDHMKELKATILDPQTAKILIDTKMKLASKLYPELYGDKSITENRNLNIDTNAAALTESDIQIFKGLGFQVE